MGNGVFQVAGYEVDTLFDGPSFFWPIVNAVWFVNWYRFITLLANPEFDVRVFIRVQMRRNANAFHRFASHE